MFKTIILPSSIIFLGSILLPTSQIETDLPKFGTPVMNRKNQVVPAVLYL